ncbi:hypothetical protein WG66_004252 [Moniliophthora roreri]|uniref:Uncharacterized protein n=1 Tax=Moniliophthora roreri TaxID=221103 RepID=A0A0W0GE43_MONRR|nr:hypothetical protein WG66_004252 [Moniliophthora roreri]
MLVLLWTSLVTQILVVQSFSIGPITRPVTAREPATVTWFRSAEETEGFILVKSGIGEGRIGAAATVKVKATPGQTEGIATLTFIRPVAYHLVAVQTDDLGNAVNSFYTDTQPVTALDLASTPSITSSEPITSSRKQTSELTDGPSSTSVPSSSRGHRSLHPAAISGIVIGCSILLGACSLAIWHRQRLRRKYKDNALVDAFTTFSNTKEGTSFTGFRRKLKRRAGVIENRAIDRSNASSRAFVSSQSTSSNEGRSRVEAQVLPPTERHIDAGPIPLERSPSGRLPPAYEDLIQR